jgi:hypothetical protein
MPLGPMKLYRLLQAHVGAVNAIVVALYEEKITPEEASVRASAQILETVGALREAEAAPAEGAGQ